MSSHSISDRELEGTPPSSQTELKPTPELEKHTTSTQPEEPQGNVIPEWSLRGWLMVLGGYVSLFPNYSIHMVRTQAC